jgi:hypothetical protein
VTRRKTPAAAEPATPPERPESYRQTLHLACDASDLQDLDAIADRVRNHPIHGRLHSNVGRKKAARFAIAQFARLPVDKWPS